MLISGMTRRSLALLFAVFSFATGGLAAPEPGFLEGDLSIHSEKGVDLADKPSPTPDQTLYKEYGLAVFSKDHQTEIAEVAVDEHGQYRLPLPPGEYVLDMKKRAGNRPRVAPRPFTITSQKTTKVDMEINIFPPPM